MEQQKKLVRQYTKNRLKLEQEIGLKQMMNHEKRIKPVIKLNLKL